jgi:hypothetical protein
VVLDKEFAEVVVLVEADTAVAGGFADEFTHGAGLAGAEGGRHPAEEEWDVVVELLAGEGLGLGEGFQDQLAPAGHDGVGALDECVGEGGELAEVEDVQVLIARFAHRPFSVLSRLGWTSVQARSGSLHFDPVARTGRNV